MAWPQEKQQMTAREAARRRLMNEARTVAAWGADGGLQRIVAGAVSSQQPEQLVDALARMRAHIDKLEATFRVAWGEPIREGQAGRL